MEKLVEHAAKPIVPIVRQMMSSSKVGVVVSAGKMDRAVKVRIAGQEWNTRFRKFFPASTTHIVADPNNSLLLGDVVRIASGWRTSKSIRHVVTAIVAPFGPPVEERPPVLTEQQRMEIRIQERLAKDVRSAAKGRLVSKDRIREARKQSIRVPTLEEALKNVRLGNGPGASLGGTTQTVEVRKEAHKGQIGQMIEEKERRKEKGSETKEEVQAKERRKDENVQTPAD